MTSNKLDKISCWILCKHFMSLTKNLSAISLWRYSFPKTRFFGLSSWQRPPASEIVHKIVFRENAPTIIFIDEIDAVAGKRSFGGNNSEFGRMTINQLLQEMDGFKSQSDVFVIGATNLKDSLDPGMVKIIFLLHKYLFKFRLRKLPF